MLLYKLKFNIVIREYRKLKIFDHTGFIVYSVAAGEFEIW